MTILSAKQAEKLQSGNQFVASAMMKVARYQGPLTEAQVMPLSWMLYHSRKLQLLLVERFDEVELDLTCQRIEAFARKVVQQFTVADAGELKGGREAA